MTDCTEDIDNQYIFVAILAIRENKTCLATKARKDYIDKNFVSGVEGELIEGIAVELLDHTITENRPTTKGNSYFIRKKTNTPINDNSVNTTPVINKCECFSDTDQQFNAIILKSHNTPVIKSTPNMLSNTEDTPKRYNNSKISSNNLKLKILLFLNSKIMLSKCLMKF